MKKLTLKKKSTAAPVAIAAPEPTLEERVASANMSAQAFVGMFEMAAHGLETSANNLEVAQAEAQEEAERLTRLADDARLNAHKRREQAANIRALVGGAASE